MPNFRALRCLLVPAVLGTLALISPHMLEAQKPASAFAKLPLAFEPNRGQSDPAVRFLAHTPEATVYLTGADAVLETSKYGPDGHGKPRLESSAAVRMHLLGAATEPVAATEEPLAGTVNYLRGKDSSQWQRNVPTFGGVRLQAVYPGVDLKYYGQGSTLEYDFLVAPGADAAQVKLRFEGSEARLGTKGELVLPERNGQELRFDKPVAYQWVDGKRVPVEASFALAANHEVSFALGAYDHAKELVIDPTLVFIGTLGTGTYPAHTDIGQITVNSAGEMFFIGTTNDAKFPVTANAYQKVCGPTKGNGGQVTYAGGYCPSGGGGEQAAFISKLSADGTKLVYSTYLSGQSGTEQGISITVDAAGVAYLLGTTGSDDFPVTANAFQKNCLARYGVFGGPNILPCDGYYNGGGTEYTIQNQNAFFAKLSADGSSLLYSSFLSGTLPVYPNTIALDASGNIYLSGQTVALDAMTLAPCADGYQPRCQPNVQFTGLTSSGYQTISAAKRYDNSSTTIINSAAFLSKFSNDGATLLYGTFFSDNSYGVDVSPTTMTVGANGVVFLGGYTQATYFPTTTGAVKSACTYANPQNYNGIYCQNVDGYVAAIDTTKAGAASLVYSTRLGGSELYQGNNFPRTNVYGLAADSSNNAYVTGITLDSTFPVPSTGFQSACPNNMGNVSPTTSGYIERCDSAIVLKLNPTGTKLLGGSFLGGPNLRSAESTGYNVRLDSKGQVYLYGVSNDGGGDFPQVNPLQAYHGGNNLFIAAFSTDLSKLLFSTRFTNPAYTDHSVTVAGGMALDGSDNIYFGGTTTDVTFGTTAGTYSTPGTTGDRHTFFAKISKVLSPTATTLTLPATAVNQGSNFNLVAKVAGTLQTTPVPTGTVTFSYTNTTPATVAGTATLDATGTATLSVAAPAAGTYTVLATYSGDTSYDVSTSAAGTLTSKTLTTPTVNLSASPATGNPATSFTFTATLPAAGGVTPTGTVYFMDGSTTLGSTAIAAGSAAYSTVLGIGTHSITARYSGDANFATQTSAAQSVTVTTFASNVTVSASATSISPGASVTFTASVTATGATANATGTVTFLDGTTTLGSGALVAGSATYTTGALATGSHSITVRYAGDANYAAGTSAAQVVTVVASASATTLTSPAASVTVGSAVTLTATVKATGSTAAPTGTVTFLDGATVLGTGAVANGVVSYTTASLAVGTHSLTAMYGGDANFAGSTSAVYTLTVAPAAQGTILLTASPATLTIKRGVTGTVLITATPTGGPVTGTLTFGCGNVPRHASCGFNPMTLVFSNSTAAQQTTLSFATNVAALVLPANPLLRGNRVAEVLAAGLFLPLGLLAFKRRKGLTRMGLLVLALAASMSVMGLTGCGGDSAFNDVATGSYTVPVTATVNGSTSTLNVTIVVTD